MRLLRFGDPMKRRTKDRPHFELPVEQWLAQRRAIALGVDPARFARPEPKQAVWVTTDSKEMN